MVNRLSGEASPYLRQHAGNPVDWYPWGPEAFDRAEAEDRPILLSIGYSSCHWCHVMAHESFEDDDTAALLNRLFVNVKVDGTNATGPHLDGVVGRAVAGVADFRYSDAMAAHGGDWTPEVLEAFLADPKGVIPGTKMTFAGLPKVEDRANVVADTATPASP